MLILNMWGKSRRCHGRQGTLQLLRDTSDGPPSSGGGSSNQGSKHSSNQLTLVTGSRESKQAGMVGRGLRVKVNLPIFKVEKTKDAVTHNLWQWDIAVFLHLGWDDQCLLSYIFQSLQGLLGDLAKSLVEDATLTDVLQMLKEHYSVAMTFDALSKEFYSLKQGSEKNVAEFRLCLSQPFQILQLEYLGKVQQEHIEEMNENISMRA